ncbi:hypothetical protein KI387_029545, partial [Taxus chinensis]
VDGPTLKRDNEGMVDTIGGIEVKSVIVVIRVVDIDDVGSSWDTMGSKVEEGKANLVLADIEVGVRERGMDIGMPYTSYPDES